MVETEDLEENKALCVSYRAQASVEVHGSEVHGSEVQRFMSWYVRTGAGKGKGALIFSLLDSSPHSGLGFSEGAGIWIPVAD